MIGQSLAQYEIVRRLGAGGMGEVFLARDTVLRRLVALKILPGHSVQTPETKQRFIDEARAASILNHPNIATIHDLRQSDDTHFIVMEYVDGETLKAKAERGQLDAAEIIAIASQIGEALDAAHAQGVIHRDIKSSNIMQTPRGQVKVLDFGLAKRTAGDDSTREGTRAGVVMGTTAYMSPEQALGHGLDARSDLFSLGVVLYELAAGRLPFSGSTIYETLDQLLHHDPSLITAINSRVPAELCQIIMRLLEKSPDDRFQSASELLKEIRRCGAAARAARDETARHNLPQHLTRFIGRQREIAQVRRLLSSTRLLTLTGPGGIGKSRLALQAAVESLQQYEDGVWLVELASLLDPGLLPQTVASSLGVREERGRTIADSVIDFLKRRQVLLVLDNCEHLIAGAAQLTEDILRRASNVQILATSREALSITGETVFLVPPLGVPDPRHAPDVVDLHAHEAIELFVDRARAVKSTFSVTRTVAAPLAAVCSHLEGIPLAIELAASRMKVLSIEQIADRLHDRLKLLTGGSRTALPRQQTLAAAIDWSYNLLTESEQALFRRLSVFSGGWTLEAAEFVCVGDAVDRPAVLELLSGLVDKSLVLVEEREAYQRYRCMVTLLEYAQQRLTTLEKEALCRKHAEFFMELVVDGESKLMSADQRTWLELLNAEYDNIRAALAWTSRNNREQAMRFAGALGRFWLVRGYWDEGSRWLAQLLEDDQVSQDSAARVRAMNAAANLAFNRGEYASSDEWAGRALTLSRRYGDTREAATALNALAVVDAVQGDLEKARSLFHESLTMRRALGDLGLVAVTLNNLGNLALQRDELAVARSLFEEALAASRRAEDKHGIAMGLVNLAEAVTRMGDHAWAQALLEESLASGKELDDKALIPTVINSLGDVLARQGQYAAARPLQEECLELSRELGEKRLIASALQSLGVLAEQRGEYPAARASLEESLSVSRELDAAPATAVTLTWLGGVAAREGNYADALALHEKSLAMCEASGRQSGIARALAGLADVARLQGQVSLAASLCKRSLAIWRELGEKPEFLRPLNNLASIAAARAQDERAVRLWGAEEAFRNASSAPRPANEVADYVRLLSNTRTRMGESDFTAAWTRGQEMDIERTLAYALDE